MYPSTALDTLSLGPNEESLAPSTSDTAKPTTDGISPTGNFTMAEPPKLNGGGLLELPAVNQPVPTVRRTPLDSMRKLMADVVMILTLLAQIQSEQRKDERTQLMLKLDGILKTVENQVKDLIESANLQLLGSLVQGSVSAVGGFVQVCNSVANFQNIHQLRSDFNKTPAERLAVARTELDLKLRSIETQNSLTDGLSKIATSAGGVTDSVAKHRAALIDAAQKMKEAVKQLLDNSVSRRESAYQDAAQSLQAILDTLKNFISTQEQLDQKLA